MDFTKYHVWFRYSSRWWWFQRFCYFMLFLPPKIGGNDPMTNWPSGSLEWYVNLFGVLSSALCLRFFCHLTLHHTFLLCNLQSEIGISKLWSSKSPGGWWFGIWGSTFRLRTRFFFNPGSSAKFAYESRKVQIIFQGQFPTPYCILYVKHRFFFLNPFWTPKVSVVVTIF